MSDDLIKLIVGFLLTTLCGGLLGFFFQHRQACFQWERSRREKELGEAQAAFEEISRLLDRRLYRTRQLLWSFNRKPDDREQRLADYRKIVTRWNDNINRILALLAIHFSDSFRDAIDYQIGAEFVAIGGVLEKCIRGELELASENLQKRLDGLAKQIYDFNLDMLRKIRTMRQHA